MCSAEKLRADLDDREKQRKQSADAAKRKVIHTVTIFCQRLRPHSHRGLKHHANTCVEVCPITC